MRLRISVPDRLFRAAERASKRMEISRSQFYARAVQSYLQQRETKDITRRLDAVYAKSNRRPFPGVESLSLEVLRRDPW